MLFVFSRTRWRSSFFCHLLLFVTFSLAPYYLITSTWEFDSACTYLRTYVVCLWSVNVGKSRQKSVPTHSKPCRQYWPVGAKFGNISPCRRHVADISSQVACTKCVQVSISGTCKKSCTKTCNADELHENVQHENTWYRIHEFLREGVQHICVARFHATHLHETCTEFARNMHGTCRELARKLVKFYTKVHTPKKSTH